MMEAENHVWIGSTVFVIDLQMQCQVVNVFIDDDGEVSAIVGLLERPVNGDHWVGAPRHNIMLTLH